MSDFWGAFKRVISLGEYPKGMPRTMVQKISETESATCGDFDFKMFFDKAPDGMVLADAISRQVIFSNAAAQRMLGFTGEEIKCLKITDMHPRTETSRLLRMIDKCRSAECQPVKNLTTLKKDGAVFYSDVSAFPMSMGGCEYVMGIYRDVTERKIAEDRVAYLDRLYKVNSTINRTIIKAKSKEALFKAVCASLVDVGGFAMVWIGLADYDKRMILPVAYGGKGQDYLKNIKVSLDPKSPYGRGPTGRAVRSGKRVVCNDILNDPKMKPWRIDALNFGYSSSIALPLKIKNRILGAISLYSDQPAAFTEKEELSLLDEVAMDVSFALFNLDLEAKASEAYQAVRERDERFKEFAEQVPGILFQLERDPQGKYSVPFCSPALERQYGIKAEQVTRDAGPVMDTVLPEDRAKIISALEKSAKDLKPTNVEFRVRDRLGGVRWLLSKSTPEKLPSGKVIWHGYHTDITELKDAELALNQEKAKAESYLNVAQVVMLFMDRRGKIRLLNRKGYQLLGYEEGELLGKDWFKTCLPTPESKKLLVMYKRMLSGSAKPLPQLENHVLTKDGKLRSMLWYNTPINDSAGKVIGVLCSGEDVTSRRQIEEALRKSEDEFRRLYQMTPAMLHSIDGQGRLVSVSDYWLDKMGYTREEVLGKRSTDFLTKESKRYAEKEVLPIFFKSGTCINVPYRLVKKNGEIIDVLLSATSEKDENGLVVRSLAVMQDVTEKNKAENALRESEKNFRRLYEETPAMLYSIDPEARLLSVSNFWLKKMGYKSQEVLGRDYTDFMTPKSRDFVKKIAFPSFLKTGVINSQPYQFVKKDGGVLDALVSATAEKDDKGKVLRSLSVIEDVTERLKAEKSLREALAKDEALLSSIADGVVAIDDKGRVILVNEAALKMLGFPRREILGKTWHQIMPCRKESGTGKTLDACAMETVLNAGGQVTDSAYFTRKNGTSFPVSRTVSAVTIGGKIQGAIKIFRDITAEKELERAKTDFLSMVSHQLRTPLVSIKWAIELFKMDKNLDSNQLERLEGLTSANERLMSLVGSMLNVTRIEAGRFVIRKEPTEVRRLVTDAIADCRSMANMEKKTLIGQMPARKLTISLDPILIKETLANLMENAINYAPNRTAITVSIKLREGRVLFAVRNKGSYIPKDEKEKIFRKFYRGRGAKEKRPQGSGLGLYVAKAAVEAHGGKIWFTSDRKEGTAFYFDLPKGSKV